MCDNRVTQFQSRRMKDQRVRSVSDEMLVGTYLNLYRSHLRNPMFAFRRFTLRRRPLCLRLPKGQVCSLRPIPLSKRIGPCEHEAVTTTVKDSASLFTVVVYACCGGCCLTNTESRWTSIRWWLILLPLLMGPRRRLQLLQL